MWTDKIVEYKTSREWEDEYNIWIIDASGWGKSSGELGNKCFSEKISEDEFENRLCRSVYRYRTLDRDQMSDITQRAKPRTVDEEVEEGLSCDDDEFMKLLDNDNMRQFNTTGKNKYKPKQTSIFDKLEKKSVKKWALYGTPKNPDQK